uniref:Uncharacterized protein n=2 Tax=Emiliania huxleyi TaxID=2903 RepID=A0A7S3WZC2_EMIHU
MNLDVPDEPLKEKMLVMKAGNGINPEHVATIVSAMFIEAGHDEFEHKLTLQHGRNSTFYLLGDLPDEFTFESMASSIATIGATTTIDSYFVEKFLGGDPNDIPDGGTIVFSVADVDDAVEDTVPVKIDRNKPDPYDLYLRLSAPPQPGALLGSIDAGEVHNALVSEFKAPRVCSLGIANLRKNVIKAFGGEALQLSSQTYYCEIHVARGGVKQDPIAIAKPPSKMITTGCGAKLMVEILPQIRARCAPAVKWAMDQSKASEEGTLIYFERVSARSQGETYQAVSTPLQKGLYDLCDTYGIAMPYRNGVQFDKAKTYFGFHNELQKNAFVDAFNINPKGIPQIKLNHLGTIFVDKNGFDWKVGFTNKNMTIFCDKCLKLTPRTSYCKPVKDRIIHLQQMGLVGSETQLMCTCIGVYRGGKKNMASKDEVESKRDEIRRRKRARQGASSSSNADTQNTA